jgi:hypothetical protein
MAERKSTRKTTSKKSTERKTTKRASSSSTRRKSSTASSRRTSSSARTTRRRSATSASRTSRTATLSSDLKKFADESYETSELTHGALLMVQSEGVEILREAALALFASKIPLVGGAVGDQAVEGITRKLADDYKKLAAADRKAVRAVVNWLDGRYEVDEQTATRLMDTFSRPREGDG